MLSIIHHIKNEICIVKINGGLTVGTIENLKKYTKECTSDEKLLGVIFDLQNVNIIDSTGIAFFVSNVQDLQPRNIILGLCNVNAERLKMLQLMQLDKVINIYGTEEDAISSVSAQ